MNEPQLTVQTGEMKRVKCNGVGDNNGFYEMEVKITQNEPQLSAEMEKRFDEALGVGTYGKIVSFDDIKHFLATALEEQRASIIAQLQKLEAEKWQDEEHCSCLRYAIHILNGKEL